MYKEINQEDIDIVEAIIKNSHDNLYSLIMFSMLFLYVIAIFISKYKEISFKYIRIIVAIATIFITTKFSYIFYGDEQLYAVSKEIRELQLKKMESSNNEYKDKIDIFIKSLEEDRKKISSSMNSVNDTIQGVTYVCFLSLIILFFRENFFIVMKDLLNVFNNFKCNSNR